MASFIIRPYEISDRPQVEAIFWETSSRKEFTTEAEREKFLNQYLGQFLKDVAFVAEEGQRILGYIVGVTTTDESKQIWGPHMSLFLDLYERYPAHLHINCTSDARGKGVGGELLKVLEQEMQKRGVKGIHLITSSTARNVTFYLRHAYTHKIERLFNDRPLLFLGKTL